MPFGTRPTATPRRSADVLARAHGAFNIVGGAWPLVSMRTFEWVFGSKQDKWLERTVAGLLVSAGWSQTRASASPAGRAHARRTGLGTATTLLAIDLFYVPRGTLRWTYLLDAAMETAWIVAWCRTDAGSAGRRTRERTPSRRGIRGRRRYSRRAP
ncbi:hypothetical protein [Actinomadura sediminis]|uniref:Uncharacterized protein n=1 Tax=Actinomadura sediminis TaxID=1038904 RepID=A0ABW3EU89_9ACTN